NIGADLLNRVHGSPALLIQALTQPAQHVALFVRPVQSERDSIVREVVADALQGHGLETTADNDVQVVGTSLSGAEKLQDPHPEYTHEAFRHQHQWRQRDQTPVLPDGDYPQPMAAA